MISFDSFKNIYDILLSSKNNSPDKIAISDGNVSLTYSNLLSYIDITIEKFTSLGIKSGTRVSLYGDATIQWVVAFLSLLSMGAETIPINPFLDEGLILKLISFSGAKYAIFADTMKIKCDDVFKEKVSSICNIKKSDVYGLDEIVKIYDKPYDIPKVKLCFDYDDKKPSLLIFTSGTEAEPKLTCLSQYNILSSLRKLYLHFQDILYIGSDRCMIAIPLNHIYGIIILLQTLLHSFTGYITSVMTPQNISKMITKYDIKSLYSVAMIFDALIKSPSFDESRNILTANFISGAKLDKNHYELYKKSYPHATFFNVYGTTEATGAMAITCKNYFDTYEDFISPLILDGYDVAVAKNGSISKNTGDTGEIVFKSNTMMLSYYNLCKDKQNIDSDGWFHTGDIGTLLCGNRLLITGRIKDIIIKGAENISVREIENEIIKDKTVDKVAVVARPDDRYGEEIYAYITLKDKENFDEKVLKENIASTLGHFKVPKEIKVIDSMPYNTLGKIIKGELR